MKEELRALLWPKGPRQDIWAIVDTARDQRAYFSLTNTFLNASCLFAGALPQALEMAAPYLVQLYQDDKFTDFLLEQWGKSVCIYLRCDIGLNDLRRHLRGFLRVKDTSGRMMLFRYYDPRVMRVYLPTCGPGELDTVFGPIQAYIMESQDAKKLLEFQVERRKLKQTERPIQLTSAVAASATCEIQISEPLLVVQRTPGEKQRVPVELIGGGKGGKLTRSGPEVQLFRSASAGKELAFVDNVCELPPSDLSPDLTLFLEGTSAATASLKLELKEGGKAEASVAIAEIKLETGAADQYKDGIAVGASRAQELAPTRRRRIEVNCKLTKEYDGKLELRGLGKAVGLQIFDSPDAEAGYKLETPFEFDPPREPRSFWLEGSLESVDRGDGALQIGPAASDLIADSCVVTVASISSISAEIPATPKRTARIPGNLPEVVVRTTAEMPVRLTLLSGSVDSASPVRLRAVVQPAGLPVSWIVTRYDDDNAAVAALAPKPLPSIESHSASAAGRLFTDAAGSFKLRAVAGSTKDPESWGGPSFDLELDLVHAQLVENRSAANPRFASCARDAVTGHFVLRSGREGASVEESPLRMAALVRLTGGGPDGMRGLDAIEGGWINNLLSDNTGARYKAVPPYLIAYAMRSAAGERMINIEEGPLLDTSGQGGGGAESCMTHSEPRGSLSAHREPGEGPGVLVELRAYAAPLTSWNSTDHTGRPIEQIWSYSEFRAFLALWSAQAPALVGSLLHAAWSFTGDYICSGTRTAATVAPARIAIGRTTPAPSLVSGAAAGVEIYPPVTAATSCRVDHNGRRLPDE
jgi:hypothetical protein